MKTKIIPITIINLLIAFSAIAQLKVFTGGNITIGSTAAPAGGFKMHVQGNSLFSKTGFTGSSAAFIRGHNEYSDDKSPDYTWWGDDQTGIFHPAEATIAFSLVGEEIARFNYLGHLLMNTTFENNFRLSINGKRDESVLGMSLDFTHADQSAQISYVNLEKTKSWVVFYNEHPNFWVYGNGDVYSATNYYYSDSTLKENVHTIQDARSKILSLRGVKYNLKAQTLSNPNDTFTVISQLQPPTQIGLIAQEVERVLPEVVTTTDHNIKAVAYANLIALLIEGYKQQDSLITSLQNQITACCAANVLPGSTLRLANPNIKEGRLDQNKPNPFNVSTKINYSLPENSTSNILMIFDMQGLLIKQYNLNGHGEGAITIEASEFKPGMYLYSLIIDRNEIDTKRMILTQ